MDRLGRLAAIGLGVGRIGLGSGAFFATRPALRGLGFPETDSTGVNLARMLGARDVGLGAISFASRDQREALRTATLIGVALDSGDVLAFSRALRDPATRRAALGGLASAGFAAGAGLWAWHRLG